MENMQISSCLSVTVAILQKEKCSHQHEADHANQGRLVQACDSRPTEERYEEAIQHLKKVAIENEFDLLSDGKGLDLIADLQDSKIPSMATASGKSFDAFKRRLLTSHLY
jgi:hypothetical protein